MSRFGPRKRRTRAHVLADLSVNHVERHALRRGFSVERMFHDYGLDLSIFTYNRRGEVESGGISVQLKASDRVRKTKSGDIALRIERAHLLHWIREIFPVMLVVYDAAEDIAYYLHVQGHLQHKDLFRLQRIGETVTLRIPLENVVSEEAIHAWARIKARVAARRFK